MTIDTIFYVAILIYSIIAHEIAHGYMAYFFGDKTAYHAGRLTMNPIPHIDPLGSVVLPVLSALSFGGAIIGWAKPVPYNPYNLKNQRLGEVMVSAAGVLINIILAIIFAILYRFFVVNGYEMLAITSSVVVIINLSLAALNLLPLPPFDGMRIITGLFPSIGRKVNSFVDKNGIAFTLVSLFIAIQIWGQIFPYVKKLANTLMGI